jgi:hypothetical protein
MLYPALHNTTIENYGKSLIKKQSSLLESSVRYRPICDVLE